MYSPGTTISPRYRDVISTLTVFDFSFGVADEDEDEDWEGVEEVRAWVMVDWEGCRYSWVRDRIMLRSFWGGVVSLVGLVGFGGGREGNGWRRGRGESLRNRCI